MEPRIVSDQPDPSLLLLPWSAPLDEWSDEHVLPLPRGLSRHVVRIVRPGRTVYAVKETEEEIAFREYNLLVGLHRLGLPAVVPQGVVTDRVDRDGDPLPAMLITEHLHFSLPYRSLFSHGLTEERLPALVDALVVLLVRLHLAHFYWGDVSLSNVLFRRNAGEFAAYLVDAETGELKEWLSDRLREYDLTVGCENVFAELLDLQASESVSAEVEAMDLIELIQSRYAALWSELTAAEEFSTDEMWRVEQRIERLNDLGFDVQELDVVTAESGDTVRIQPRVVELGHHRRELAELTGLVVEDNQARRLLNDLAAFTAHFNYGAEDRLVVGRRWLTTVYEPIMALVPVAARGKLEPAEIFHQILEHRWFLSEGGGHEWDIFDTARDYIENVLQSRPNEALADAETGVMMRILDPILGSDEPVTDSVRDAADPDR